jgi:hypothetical protein
MFEVLCSVLTLRVHYIPDEKLANAGTFKIMHEDHTVGNMLRMYDTVSTFSYNPGNSCLTVKCFLLDTVFPTLWKTMSRSKSKPLTPLTRKWLLTKPLKAC